MNVSIIMGRLTADPEIRMTQTGKTVIQFTLAVNRRFSQNKEADFIRCVAWEKTAEFISKYFFKGSMLAVVGELRTRTYQDQNGQNRSVTEVLVNEAHFTGEKQNTNQSTNQNTNQTPDFDTSGFGEIIDDDDLPF